MYEHLRFGREEPINNKRTKGGYPPSPPPPRDIAAHGRKLLQGLSTQRTHQSTGGFDERKVLRLSVNNSQVADLLTSIPGVEFISQEHDSVILAFATENSLQVFEERLTQMIGGGTPTRKEILYAIQAISNVTPEDRTGTALRIKGFPENGSVDVELLPVAPQQMNLIHNAFLTWLSQNGINNPLSDYRREGLILYRLKLTQDQLSLVLENRDVRMVDLPPSFGISRSIATRSIREFLAPLPPPDNAPRVAILDSGILSNHPLLKPAIGDTRSFEPTGNPVDQHGHGTFVSGIALYGDIESAVDAGSFEPKFWLLSGKILDDGACYNPELIEAQIDRAVRDFHDEYQCKIFNLSIGDINRVYDGRHLRGLAFTLDSLSRELGVVFVVSSGNYEPNEEYDWLEHYPDYLVDQSARLIDPAPAINVITVGSIVKHEATYQAQRNNTIEDVPIARLGYPSPFTRTGPSLAGIIKPDFVAHGGNLAVTSYRSKPVEKGIGVLSLSHQGVSGALFSEDRGTSFSAPYITHLLGRLKAMMPEASVNLLRSIIAVNSKHETVWSDPLLGARKNDFFGYGVIDDDFLYRSTNECVVLYAEDTIENEKCHFYELPIPQEYFQGRRTRELAISLSYMPITRTTRLDYKGTQIEYRLVLAESLEKVTSIFQKNSDLDSLAELTDAKFKSTLRSKGTLQCDRWLFKGESQKRINNKFFLIVSRKDKGWAESLADLEESYAISIQLRDRENASANHYLKIQQTLQQRTQLRQRGRV